MEGINKKYNIELEILTPLSIGAGAEKDWVRGVDFVVDKGILYKLNLKKMVANGINPNELTSFFATKNDKYTLMGSSRRFYMNRHRPFRRYNKVS